MDDNAREEFEKLVADVAAEASNMAPLHELYMQFRQGGFTRYEALCIIAYGMFHGKPDDGDNG
jgi:hypothetical protein